MQRKAEKKKLIGKRNQIHEASAPTKVPPPNALTVRGESHPFLTKDTIPRALVESPEQDAIYSFFTEFILHTTHPDSQCGIFEHLLPLYTSARHDSVLSLAASAVALVISGGAPHRRPRFQMGRVINGIALKKVALAIQDPIQSVQDQTLMAVLLLGFFDRLHHSAMGIKCTGAHEAGAVALIKHREKQNHQSELSTKLLLAVHSAVVDTAFQYSGANEKLTAELTELVLDLPQNTANRLTVISANAAELGRLAKTVLPSQSTLASTNEIHRILNIALEINSQFKEWAQSVPENWAWYPASGFDCPPDRPRELFVYQDRIDFYSEPTMAKVWNSYRSRRMMILFTVLDCVYELEPSYNDILARYARDSLQVTQELVDDICASVPYIFGTKTYGGPGDRACFEYPYYGTTKLSAEHRRAAAALGALSLSEPLNTSLSAVSLRKGQKKWIVGQIMRIGASYNLKGPSIGLHNLPVDALQDIQSDDSAFQNFSQFLEKMQVCTESE